MSTPVDPTPRPEGHRAVAWLAMAMLAGLALGLLLLSAAETDTPDAALQTLKPAALEPRSGIGDAGGEMFGWSYLELPNGELRRAPSTAALPVLLALKDELDRPAADARFDFDRQRAIAEQPGRRLDIDASLSALEAAQAAGLTRSALVFEVVEPQRRAPDLDGLAHDGGLGAFETPCDCSGPRGAGGRNLERLAGALDGRVLMSGETFSFNALVGPREESRGYEVAAALAIDEPVDGVGSSASRAASTLHAAASFAGLAVLERHRHPGPRPVIELGLEAAVAFPTLDLQLQNPYDFPVVLRVLVTSGRLRAEVRGRRRPYAITLLRKVEGVTAIPEVEREDAELPLGERVLAQRGVPGVALRWHLIRREGEHARRHTSLERYAPIPRVILVGTGTRLASATGRPQREPSPEYVLNELLVMTQSDALDGSLVVQRVPGRFGTAGWAKNVGEPTSSPPPGLPTEARSAAPSVENLPN